MNMIAIFTDFGHSGPYLGQMHAAIHAQTPGGVIVDLFPDLPAFNIRAAAYLLPAYTRFLPPGTVCLCVVDPGVGTSRRALALQLDGRWYVGPDNGLFRLQIQRASRIKAFEIVWRPEHLSDSFHGRDLFAPVAARLLRQDLDGLQAIDPALLESPDWPDALYEVIYIDHYGNAVTGLSATDIQGSALLEVEGQRCSYRRTFAEAEPGQFFWYENSNGLVEIALNQGSASEHGGIGIGASVSLVKATP
jgi:S-adenosylmethionine hydrolase